MPLLCENRTANPRQTPSAKLVATKTPCRYCLHSSLLPLFHPRTQKPHSRFLARRRRPVRAYSRYDQGTTRRSHSSPIPKEISSAVHSLSFNQQVRHVSLFLLLAIVLTHGSRLSSLCVHAAPSCALYTSSCSWHTICPQPPPSVYRTTFGCVLHTRLTRSGQASIVGTVTVNTQWSAACWQSEVKVFSMATGLSAICWPVANNVKVCNLSRLWQRCFIEGADATTCHAGQPESVLMSTN